MPPFATARAYPGLTSMPIDCVTICALEATVVAPADDEVGGGAGSRQVPGPSGAPVGPPVATAGSGWMVAAQDVTCALRVSGARAAP